LARRRVLVALVTGDGDQRGPKGAGEPDDNPDGNHHGK
jgi:hypothetical protein